MHSRLNSECMTGVIQHIRLLAKEKFKCRADNTGNSPGGLFDSARFNFSVFTRVMVSLSAIYCKYA